MDGTAVRRALLLIIPPAAAAIPFIVFLLSGSPGLPGLPAENPPVPGDSDVYEQAWHFWWAGKAIREGSDPRVCPLIGLPPPHSLAGQNIGWPDALLFGPLLGDRPADALFAALMAGTALTFAAGFLFAGSWGLDGYGSMLAALFITWAPARTAHLMQHYSIACFGWAILSMACARLFLVRGRAALLAASGMALLIASMESAYHAMIGAAGIAAVAAASLNRPCRGRIPALAAVTGVALGASLLFYAAFPGRLPAVEASGESVYWSAEPLSYLLPSPFGLPAVLAGMQAGAFWMPNLFEGVVTPGFVMMLLAMAAVLRRPAGRCADPMRRNAVTLALLSIIPFVLALGPRLKLFATPTGIPLPYALILKLPFLEGARSASRFAMLGAALLAVPAAYALRRLGRGAGTAVAVLAAVELIPPALPSVSGAVPSFYSIRGEGACILEIPASPTIRRYALFMTADSRERPVFFHARRAAPLDPSLEPFMADSRRPVTDDQAEATGVDLIVYNRWMFEPGERDRLDAMYSGIFDDPRGSDSVWVWRR